MAADRTTLMEANGFLHACLGDERCGMEVFTFTVKDTNPYHGMADDRYRSWDKSIECGRGYMVGERMTIPEFLRSHRSRLSPWQRAAFRFCTKYPQLHLNRVAGNYDWDISRRGEYVEFRLPFHSNMGEKTYLSRDGKSKILVNVD